VDAVGRGPSGRVCSPIGSGAKSKGRAGIYARYFVKEPEVRVKNRPQKREVRVCYHQGAIFGGLVTPVLAFFAVNFNLGYAVPMLVGTVVAAASVVISLLLSPETKGTVLVAELQVA
jgi:hypothetical protein